MKGYININDEDCPLDNQHFILRGCSLRNTKYLIGLVAYTGFFHKNFLIYKLKGMIRK